MSDSVLSNKYQILIPRDVRERAGIKPGDVFDVAYIDGTISLVRIPSVDELFGMIPGIDTSLDREEDRVL